VVVVVAVVPSLGLEVKQVCRSAARTCTHMHHRLQLWGKVGAPVHACSTAS
jgi:hypothetical protein